MGMFTMVDLSKMNQRLKLLLSLDIFPLYRLIEFIFPVTSSDICISAK